MVVFFFLIFGLIIGSFLNVVVYRLKDGETLRGRSYCHRCQHQIRWYDNIPLLSFVFLGGKCRDCQAVISWQYPALELATGIGFVLVGYFFFALDDQGTWLETVWLLGIVSLFLATATYDIIHMEIPVTLLGVSALWTLLFLLITFHPGALWFESRLVHGVLGGMVVALFFFALVYASKETWMGWGDVWLGGVAGLIVGLPLVLFMLTLSFGTGALIGLLMIAFSGKHMKSQIPFAPYLVLGVLLTLFLPKIFPEFTRLFFL